MESKEVDKDLIANAIAILSEHDATLLATEGCMCCEAVPIGALRLIQLPPTPDSESKDNATIAFFICRECKDGAYDENKTLENLSTFLSEDATLI